jgi:hypothetical protein
MLHDFASPSDKKEQMRNRFYSSRPTMMFRIELSSHRTPGCISAFINRSFPFYSLLIISSLFYAFFWQYGMMIKEQV